MTEKIGIVISAGSCIFSYLYESNCRREKMKNAFTALKLDSVLATSERWMKEDPMLKRYIKCQSEWHKNKYETRDKNLKDINDGRTAVKDFFREAKELAALGPCPYFWLSRSEIQSFIPRPKTLRILQSLQYFDKVNCTSAGLTTRNKKDLCTWAEPKSSRPSIYQWIEQTYEISCEDVYSGDDKAPHCTYCEDKTNDD